MKHLKVEELLQICGGCHNRPLWIAKIIYTWKYFKMSKLVNQLFE